MRKCAERLLACPTLDDDLLLLLLLDLALEDVGAQATCLVGCTTSADAITEAD